MTYQVEVSEPQAKALEKICTLTGEKPQDYILRAAVCQMEMDYEETVEDLIDIPAADLQLSETA